MIETDYKAGQRAFAKWLASKGIALRKVEDLGVQKDGDWNHFAWTITVTNPRHDVTYEFPFKQGLGHTEKPKLVDLMASLLFDASTVVNAADFEDWAADLGYDADSRTAASLYQQVVANNARLRKLFDGAELEKILDEFYPLQEAAGL